MAEDEDKEGNVGKDIEHKKRHRHPLENDPNYWGEEISFDVK